MLNQRMCPMLLRQQGHVGRTRNNSLDCRRGIVHVGDTFSQTKPPCLLVQVRIFCDQYVYSIAYHCG